MVMQSLKSWPLGKKSILLVFAVFLVISGLVVQSGLQQRRHEIKAAEQSLLYLVNRLAAEQVQIEDSTKNLLQELAKSPEVQKLDVEACNSLLYNVKRQHPYYSVLGLVSPKGDLIASSEPIEEPGINLSAQKQIRDAIDTHDFSAGEYVIGVVTGLRTIHYSYPVLDASKKLFAVLNVGFRLDRYKSLMEKANQRTDSVVVITDHNGVRLHRTPYSDMASLGQPIPSKTFEWICSQRDEGVFEGTGGDGKDRINAFKRFRLGPNKPTHLFIIVGTLKDKLLKKSNFVLSMNLLILGIASILSLLMAHLYFAIRKSTTLKK